MKIRFSILGLVLISGLLAGCGTPRSRISEVCVGMSVADVNGILGTPDRVQQFANVEELTYYLSTDMGFGRDRPYMVRLVDGRVQASGSRFTLRAASQLNSIQLGMTYLQVIDLMGPPDTTAAAGNVQSMNYQLFDGMGRQASSYVIRLVDGKVTQFGPAS